MKMDANLYQRLEQRQLLKLSPQMIQQIEILQLPSIELQEMVKQELEENPALELVAEVPAKEKTETASTDSEGPGVDPGSNASFSTPSAALAEQEKAIQMADDQTLRMIEEQHELSPTYAFRRSSGASEDSDPMEALQNAPERGLTLQDFLHQQAIMSEANGRLRRLLEYIIDNIDDSGFLSSPLQVVVEALNRSTITAAARFLAANGLSFPQPQANPEGQPAPFPIVDASEIPGLVKALRHRFLTPGVQPPESPDEVVSDFLYTIADAEAVLKVIQNFDPKGVGARDLRESLLLQLSDADPEVASKQLLIRDHLEDITRNDLPAVAKKTGLSMDQLNALVDQIKAMNPKPGSNVAGAVVPRVVPDVLVELVGDVYEVRVEKSFLPPLCVSPGYAAILADRQASQEVKQFIRAKVDSAKRLISAIEQRRSTLQRIAGEIVKSQKAFLDSGISYLRPFKMQEVADKIGVHVSTVGRAISDKYIMTPRGVFKMKFFFTGGIETTGGKETASRVSVMARIRDLFEHEEKANPLNDDEAVRILKGEGYTVARRTIAKYRQELNIPPARMRKRF
ncbi:MAG: RNA polymerase factor sigma-54 [Planctomycetota bacterium]|nr:RNA polymerase factor sigma-54 [Planctomycetota bacterium]